MFGDNSIGYFIVSNQTVYVFEKCSFFLLVFILCLYIGSRPTRSSWEVVWPLKYTKLIQPPPSACRRTPRWWPNPSPYFQGSSSEKILTPPMNSRGPGDDSPHCRDQPRLGRHLNHLCGVIFNPQPLSQLPYVNTQPDTTRAHSTTDVTGGEQQERGQERRPCTHKGGG